jgi:translation elongation factor EF-1alpha
MNVKPRKRTERRGICRGHWTPTLKVSLSTCYTRHVLNVPLGYLEREKGKTVEVGRAFFETEGKHFTILDAPGHKSFVPNMIGGAAQADLAVLVISARKGEFETGFDRGGQTREHAMLAKTAGVRHLIVLINKMDDPTVEWSEERYRTELKFSLQNFIIVSLQIQ